MTQATPENFRIAFLQPKIVSRSADHGLAVHKQSRIKAFGHATASSGQVPKWEKPGLQRTSKNLKKPLLFELAIL